MSRKGEKFGWIGGWLGGFVWVVILSAVFLVQQRIVEGVVGLLLAAAATTLVLSAAPWKHPETPYRKLMVPVYVAFFAAIAWGVWSYEGVENLGLTWWSLFLLLPVLSPLATSGKRRWNDMERGGT